MGGRGVLWEVSSFRSWFRLRVCCVVKGRKGRGTVAGRMHLQWDEQTTPVIPPPLPAHLFLGPFFLLPSPIPQPVGDSKF